MKEKEWRERKRKREKKRESSHSTQRRRDGPLPRSLPAAEGLLQPSVRRAPNPERAHHQTPDSKSNKISRSPRASTSSCLPRWPPRGIPSMVGQPLGGPSVCCLNLFLGACSVSPRLSGRRRPYVASPRSRFTYSGEGRSLLLQVLCGDGPKGSGKGVF